MAATAENPLHHPYGYLPTEWICVLFVVLFSLSSILHLAQAVRYRLWWLLATPVIAGLLEIIGWAARLWSAKKPTALNPYIMQMTTTILAPTFLIAANFVILGQIIRRLGQGYSRLNAMWYTIVFTCCDTVALIIQAIGGATAATAVNSGQDPDSGGNIMLGGICFQLLSITAYMFLAAEFVMRFLWDRPLRATPAYEDKVLGIDRNIKLILAELTVSSVFIYIRSVYRTIELAGGWRGTIITTQVYFNVFDGAMITLAMFSLNVLHPGALLGPGSTWLSLRASAPKDVDVQINDDKKSVDDA